MQGTEAVPYPPSEILLVGDSKFLLDLVETNLAPLTAETLFFGSVQPQAPTSFR